MREIHGVKTQGMDLVKPLNYQAARRINGPRRAHPYEALRAMD